MTQIQRAQAFKALHEGAGMFVIPNPWDIGSARILAGLGYQALASTSAGFAVSRGLADYQITREMKLAHCAELAGATDLPLSADLENGFGHDPETCAETIRLGLRPVWLAGRLRTLPAIAMRRSMRLGRQLSGCGQRPRQPMGWIFRSC